MAAVNAKVSELQSGTTRDKSGCVEGSVTNGCEHGRAITPRASTTPWEESSFRKNIDPH